MWVEYNPNPKRRSVIDCTVRALCMALDMDWDAVYFALFAIGYSLKNMPSANEVWSTLLHRNGFRRYAVPDTCPDCYTARDFCRDHPWGVHVLVFTSHIATVVDGNLYDTWNSLDETPQFYWTRED